MPGPVPFGQVYSTPIRVSRRRVRDPQVLGNPKWASTCVIGDEVADAAYRRVTQFPPNSIQSKVMGKLIYLTSSNSSIMFVFWASDDSVSSSSPRSREQPLGPRYDSARTALSELFGAPRPRHRFHSTTCISMRNTWALRL